MSWLFAVVASQPQAREWRHLQPLNRSPSAIPFTFMCYNVLCDKYATKQVYPHCPSWALNWDYRRRSILEEIRLYQSDIICLQEVETEQFHTFFQPELAKEKLPRNLQSKESRPNNEQVGEKDGGRMRDILEKGSVSEMHLPCTSCYRALLSCLLNLKILLSADACTSMGHAHNLTFSRIVPTSCSFVVADTHTQRNSSWCLHDILWIIELAMCTRHWSCFKWLHQSFCLSTSNIYAQM